MTALKIPLFPVDGTAVTVTVTVWLGVCVVVFFNLRFGWTLSGLVVPGYLVPLLFVNPVAVAIIFGQAVITYGITRLMSDGWGRIPWWSSFFGRDRFFVIVLVSILVRALTDGWALPIVGRWCNDSFGLQIDYRNDLHSYGLIVVSLLANYFWKPRLLRGIATSMITVGLTYALVKYVMLNFTNFSLGSLHYLYGDVSTSLLSSPKSYIVVITTAYVASSLNLRYSWDFNGILVPALLGLLWHEPEKIAVSIVEAMWVLVLATAVLRLPIWGRVTIEGGRKLLLFFTIAAVHRLVLAHTIPLLSDYHVTDAYGFGYLLTTLMAVKAYDKKIPIRVCRSTLQASMMGAVLASFLGFGLSQLPSSLLGRDPASYVLRGDLGVQVEDAKLWEVLNTQRVQLYGMRLPKSYQNVLPREMSDFRDGVSHLLRYIDDESSNDLQRAADLLARVNYRIRVVEDRYLVLTEFEPTRGWGTFVLDPQAEASLLVEVPAPLEEWATFESGLVLFNQMRGRALAIAGAARRTRDDRSSDVLTRRNTMMRAFHRLVDEQDTVQVRGYTSEMLVPMEHLSLRDARQAVGSYESSLWIRHALPPSLNLAALSRLIQFVDIRWRVTPTQNVLRDDTSRGFAELVLSRQDRRRLRNRVASDGPGQKGLFQRVDGYLNRWLRDDRLLIARQGSNEYRPAVVEEMLFLDEEVVRPLVLLARRCASFEEMTPQDEEQAKSIGSAAAVMDYQLILFNDIASRGQYFVLAESTPRRRHWGTYVFRVGMASPYIVEVPRPLYERQTHQFGSASLDQLNASVLMIAGAHPFANRDGTSDVARLANKVNAYQLVRQVLLRELTYADLLLVQIRAIQAPIDTDLLVATDDGSSSPDELSELVVNLVDRMEQNGLTTRMVDGSAATAGYELGLLLQTSSLNHSINKQMTALWLSPALRQGYRDSAFLSLMEAQFQSVGIPTVEQELYDGLRSLGESISLAGVHRDVASTVWDYCENGDVMHLHRLVQEHPKYRFVRLVDIATDQSFLLIQAESHGLPEVINLDGTRANRKQVLSALTPDAVRRFARSRQFYLQWRSEP